MFTLVSFYDSAGPSCPHPVRFMNMEKNGVPTTAVQEQRAHLSATQVTLHEALLCIEQPRSSTVSLHHPASPYSRLPLTRLNARWMAAEWRNLRAACMEGNFLLMVAHQAPKYFSWREALGCTSLTKSNRYKDTGGKHNCILACLIRTEDPQVRNFTTVDQRHLPPNQVTFFWFSHIFAEAIFGPLWVLPVELDLSAFCAPTPPH